MFAHPVCRDLSFPDVGGQCWQLTESRTRDRHILLALMKIQSLKTYIKIIKNDKWLLWTYFFLARMVGGGNKSDRNLERTWSNPRIHNSQERELWVELDKCPEFRKIETRSSRKDESIISWNKILPVKYDEMEILSLSLHSLFKEDFT